MSHCLFCTIIPACYHVVSKTADEYPTLYMCNFRRTVLYLQLILLPPSMIELLHINVSNYT